MTLPNVNQQAGAQATPPEASEGAAPATAQPEYITKAQFDEFAQSLKDGLNKNFQAVQSQTDRYQQRVQAGLDGLKQHLELLKGEGVTLTPQQVKSLEAQVKLDALTRETQPAGQAQAQGTAQAQAQPGAGEEELDPVTQAAITLMEVEGAVVEDDDPEAAILMKAASGTQQEYYKAAKEAAKAKVERLEREKKDPAARITSNLTGSPASNPIANITSPSDLWDAAVKGGFIK